MAASLLTVLHRQWGGARHETSDPQEAHPKLARGEPKPAGSGTARVVAESEIENRTEIVHEGDRQLMTAWDIHDGKPVKVMELVYLRKEP